jgi:2-oxoglutarate ferredoxin oxidoreductase subunit gamma
MLDRYEIRLSGTGGQGLVLAGIILAEAAGIYGGKHVVQTVSYGPAARGGTSRADVVVSDREIDYPKAIALDLLLAMSQMACDESASDLKPTGVLVVDSHLVTEVNNVRVVKIPFTQIGHIEPPHSGHAGRGRGGVAGILRSSGAGPGAERNGNAEPAGF